MNRGQIRNAIQGRIDSAQDDPELITRAEAAQSQIEREAAARSAAIAGFMGRKATTEVGAEPTHQTASKPAPGAAASRSRRSDSRGNG